MANPAMLPADNAPHFSYSRLSTYMGCSLKYRFRYLDNLSPEHLPIALTFGRAVHAAVEVYYRSIWETGTASDYSAMWRAFQDALDQNLAEATTAVVFDRSVPDYATALSLGEAMLRVFETDSQIPEGWEVAGVEMPLEMPIPSFRAGNGVARFVGIIDLLLRDQHGNLMVVDHKTGYQARTQESVDSDLQLSAYCALLAANKFTFPAMPIRCGIDLIRKLKAPKLEEYHSVRTAQDRKRFFRVVDRVMAGIEQGVFYPTRSWQCQSCRYAKACSYW